MYDVESYIKQKLRVVGELLEEDLFSILISSQLTLQNS